MKTMAARFEQARVFAEVAEQASFTRAAERLGCSKAHASVTVSALEAALGVQLLHRTTRRIDLTAAGRAYLDYCRQLRDTLIEAEHAVSAVGGEVAGTLRLTMPSSFGEVFLADIAREFLREYPGVRLEADVSVARRDLAGDGYDCAVRATRAVDPSLVARPLGVLREAAVATPRLLAQYEVPQVPQDLARLPAEALSPRSDLIMTYALCGFANLGSLGILIGGLATMVPERRADIVSLGPKAVVSGTLATLLTGAVVGLLTV